jgi:hypothetical protein
MQPWLSVPAHQIFRRLAPEALPQRQLLLALKLFHIPADSNKSDLS